MRKQVTLVILVLGSFVSFAQSDVHSRTVHQRSDALPNDPRFNSDIETIKCDLHNLIVLAEMSRSDFYQLMKKYDYVSNTAPSNNPNIYVQQTILSYYNPIDILKKQGTVGFSWVKEDEDIARFKDELQPYLYATESDKTIYHIKDGDFKFDVYLHESNNEVIMIKLDD